MRSPRSLGRSLLAWARRHPFEVDVILAAALTSASVAGLLTSETTGSERSADAFGVALMLINGAAVAWRRKAPLRALGVATATQIVFWILDYSSNFDGVLLFVMYAAAAHGTDRRRTAQAIAVSLTALFVVSVIGVIVAEEDLTLFEAVGVVIIFGTAAAVGEIVYGRHQRLLDLEARAARAEAEREANARQAVLDERARIAREMHDVVAHSMSVMVVQAGAARRIIPTDPVRAVDAVATIETTGREALAEMRRLLGVLRDSSGDRALLAPQPTLADLDELVGTCRDAGLPVTFEVDGEPAELGPGRELAVYRVVQEALTNVIRHAGSARCRVHVTYEADHVAVDVVDDGMGAATALAAPAMTGAGHGLVGMRERVELYGGTFRAGPVAGGGFAVHATVPLGATRSTAPMAAR